MISLLNMRRMGPWLLGLFFAAQVAGIVPLVGAHLQHVFASQQDIADDLAANGAEQHVHHHHVHHDDGVGGHGKHDHGTDDPNDQCCTLHHHLAGITPHAVGAKASGLLIAPAIAVPPRSLVGADPGLPERPPKLPLSI
jgi:hypothetical protein